jgi:hypothetical protein
MEIEAESEEHLSKMIAQAETKFWQTWIRDNTGKSRAALYKPSGATEKWIDPVYSANSTDHPTN